MGAYHSAEKMKITEAGGNNLMQNGIAMTFADTNEQSLLLISLRNEVFLCLIKRAMTAGYYKMID